MLIGDTGWRRSTCVCLRRLRAVLPIGVLLVSFGASADSVHAALPSDLLPLPEGAVAEYAIPGEATSIAVGPEQSIWFTTSSGQIDRIEPDGLLTGQFSVPTGVGPDVPEGSAAPGDLVLGGDGNMWFIDRGRNSNGENLIGRISPAGRVSEFPVNNGRYGGITGLARGAAGETWYAGYTYPDEISAVGYLVRIDGDGHATRFEVPAGRGEDVPFDGMPQSLALGPEGDIWFADGPDVKGRALIERMTPNGFVTAVPVTGSGSAGTGDLVLGPDGDMWFQTGSTIERMTTSGTIVGSIGLEKERSCTSLVPDLDQDVWCADADPYEGVQDVARISPSGVITRFSGTGIDSWTRIVRGTGDELWYSGRGERLVRLLIPTPPTVMSLPAISGELVAGGRLTTSNGSWTGAPTIFTYQWEACDSLAANCQTLQTGIAQSVELTPDQVGHTLRAIVTATGVGGTTSATTDASGVVVFPAKGETKASVEVATDRSTPRRPIVGSSMTWRFGWARKYTIVDELVVHDLPNDGWIEVSCGGRGCPFTHRRLSVRSVRPGTGCRDCHRGRSPSGTDQLDIAPLFHRRHLGTHARIVVTVDAKGATGKTFVFTVRANRPPRIKIGAS